MKLLNKTGLLMAVVALFAVCSVQAQTFSASPTASISVTVGPEAALAVTSGATTSLSTSGTLFADYTGSTSLKYKIRTTKSGGSGSITAQVTSDFNGTGGPSVANPPSTGDALSYACTVDNPGTGCSGALTASTASATNIATFGANAHSTKAGNDASLAWTLTNDPVYETGTYTAVVTFTITAL